MVSSLLKSTNACMTSASVTTMAYIENNITMSIHIACSYTHKVLKDNQLYYMHTR